MDKPHRLTFGVYSSDRYGRAIRGPYTVESIETEDGTRWSIFGRRNGLHPPQLQQCIDIDFETRSEALAVLHKWRHLFRY